MRLWSIHPKYLDAKGLVALWRESLLAKHVLEGKTKGYRNHPQLRRFLSSEDCLSCINFYLIGVWEEAKERGYSFTREKIGEVHREVKLTVTSGQIDFERNHLLAKLKTREPEKMKDLLLQERIDVHPLFGIKKGRIEPWEIL